MICAIMQCRLGRKIRCKQIVGQTGHPKPTPLSINVAHATSALDPLNAPRSVGGQRRIDAPPSRTIVIGNRNRRNYPLEKTESPPGGVPIAWANLALKRTIAPEFLRRAKAL